jgi:hypothetical protein
MLPLKDDLDTELVRLFVAEMGDAAPAPASLAPVQVRSAWLNSVWSGKSLCFFNTILSNIKWLQNWGHGNIWSWLLFLATLLTQLGSSLP